MNFDNLEKWGRCELQCSFTNQVIFIYNAKLGSRFIDASMRYKNKYHVILDLSEASNIQVKARPIYFAEESYKNASATKCETTGNFLKSVLDGKSNKRDIIFVYRDPWEKYKSGIYQDYPLQYKNEKHNKVVKKYLDTLILKKQPKELKVDSFFDVWALEGGIFTGHSQRVLNSYKSILDNTKIDINRCQFFNMGIYGLENVLQNYGLSAEHDNQARRNELTRDRNSWTENQTHREFFYNTFEVSPHKRVIKKIMKEEIKLYKWFESHNRNFTKLYKPSIKK